nr:hypothetical protein GCM10020092_028040 [Actinoplanes digitatis]
MINGPRRAVRSVAGGQMTWNGSDEKHDRTAIREIEMGALRRALSRCAPDARWVVAEVTGDPGMGKSTLLARFGRYAADAGWQVLPWRYGQAGHPQSWQPISESEPPVEPFAEVLRSAAGQRHVLIVDDVHRADPASARLLAGLLRHPPLGPVLLVLAHRPRQLTGDLAAALATATDAGVVRRVALRPLTPAESAALLPSAPPHRRSELHEAAAGNPLYLLGSAGTPGAVPKRVRAALEPELLVGSPTERLVVWAAAVAGDPADPELIAAVAECELGRRLPRAGPDRRGRPAAPGTRRRRVPVPARGGARRRLRVRTLGLAAGRARPGRRGAARPRRRRGRPGRAPRALRRAGRRGRRRDAEPGRLRRGRPGTRRRGTLAHRRPAAAAGRAGDRGAAGRLEPAVRAGAGAG